MRRLALGILLALAPLGASCNSEAAVQGQTNAERVNAPIALTGRIIDNAGLLAAEKRNLLDARLGRLERWSGPQFVIVTVPSLQGMTIEKFGLALGNGWGIGHKQRNDGVILLIAPNEHKVRIEVGRGLEPTLDNATCGKIIADDILPNFKAGNMEAGIEAGANHIIELLTAHPSRTQKL